MLFIGVIVWSIYDPLLHMGIAKFDGWVNDNSIFRWIYLEVAIWCYIAYYFTLIVQVLLGGNKQGSSGQVIEVPLWTWRV